MKRLLPLLVLIFILPLRAQESDAATHNALRQLKATMEKALNERDLDTIVANVDPNVVFTTMNGDVCRGPEQIRAYFAKMLTAPGHIVKDVKVSFDVDALTTLYGGDTGVALGSSKDHYELTNGDTFDIQGRWTCTMVRNGDRWVIAAFHYSANVFENPILDRYRKAIWTVGIAAAVAGLILGLLLGRLFKKRA
ncbi:MAG TPA: nuclear transport factor 2 family protein [Thermoanaerobaculia bacterium]|nr:nuclear transport factor 2 family protein [Thermoanaerobaculia bacterium]